MKTIAQQIKWDFETNGDLIIKDKNGGLIYLEELRYWAKYEYDSKGKEIYFEDSEGKIRDKRPKSCEGKIVEFKGLGLLSMFEPGVKYKLVKV